MIPGIYQGASAMNALERWQTAITGNLASGSVAGFKKDETSFSSALAGSSQIEPDGSPTEFKHYAPQALSRISDVQGALRQTGKDMDMAVDGPGYFRIQNQDGSVGYTRNGEFHLNNDGKLVNRQGLTVEGEGGAIKVDLTQGPVSVDRTGQVSQGKEVIGKIPLYDLSKAGKMHRSGDGLMAPEDGVTPAKVEKPSIMQGYIEESNVVPLQEMVNLITVSRAYETSQKLITSIDQTTHSAIETLGTP